MKKKTTKIKISENKNELTIVESKFYLVQNNYTVLGKFPSRTEAQKFVHDYNG